jgi:hypothetical protein
VLIGDSFSVDWNEIFGMVSNGSFMGEKRWGDDLGFRKLFLNFNFHEFLLFIPVRR